MSHVIRRSTAVFAALALALASVTLLGVDRAAALPTGVVVTQGTVGESVVGPVMTLEQTSSVAVITVTSLDIAVGETLEIIQPDDASIMVIRNTGVLPTIAGTIESNGTVIIISSPGVTFAPSAVVTIGGDLLVTTGNTPDDAGWAIGVGAFFVVLPGGEILVSAGAALSAGRSLGLIGVDVVNHGALESGFGMLSLASVDEFLFFVGPVITEMFPDGAGFVGGRVETTGTQTALSGMLVVSAPAPSQLILNGSSLIGPASGISSVAVVDGDGSSDDLDITAVGDLLDPLGSTLGARAAAGDPMAMTFGRIQAVASLGPIPTESQVLTSQLVLLERLAVNIMQLSCQYEDGVLAGTTAIGGLLLDGLPIVPGDYDFSIPNQAPIVVPGFGSVAFNEQVTATVGGYDVLTVTGIHVVTPTQDTSIGIVDCGAPVPVPTALPATGAVPGAGIATGSALMLGGLLALVLVRRRMA